jgi:hypothetical protein
MNVAFCLHGFKISQNNLTTLNFFHHISIKSRRYNIGLVIRSGLVKAG